MSALRLCVWSDEAMSGVSKARVQMLLFGLAFVACFVDVILFRQGGGPGPGPWAAAVLGLLLLRRTIVTTPQPTLAVISGCLLTAIFIAGDHGLLHLGQPVWLAVIIAAGISFAFAERIEKLWNSRGQKQA
jgi:hypothetical protein